MLLVDDWHKIVAAAGVISPKAHLAPLLLDGSAAPLGEARALREKLRMMRQAPEQIVVPRPVQRGAKKPCAGCSTERP